MQSKMYYYMHFLANDNDCVGLLRRYTMTITPSRTHADKCVWDSFYNECEASQLQRDQHRLAPVSDARLKFVQSQLDDRHHTLAVYSYIS
jgi:hypothetical protein